MITKEVAAVAMPTLMKKAEEEHSNMVLMVPLIVTP